LAGAKGTGDNVILRETVPCPSGRVSLGPLDRTDDEESLLNDPDEEEAEHRNEDSWGSASGDEGEEDDEEDSPLLPPSRRRGRPAERAPPRKSESPRRRPGESADAFAQRMLFVCRRVAREARNDGPNLYQSDSSVSPVKRRNDSWKSDSPTKRRTVSSTVDSTISIGVKPVNYLWEPVFARHVSMATLKRRGQLARETTAMSCSQDGETMEVPVRETTVRFAEIQKFEDCGEEFAVPIGPALQQALWEDALT